MVVEQKVTECCRLLAFVCVCVGFVKTQSFLIRDSVFCKHSKQGDDVCFCVFAALNTGEHVLSVGT